MIHGDSAMYERSTQPLLHRPAFLRRAVRHTLAAFLLVAAVDLLGTLGYHTLGQLTWVDAFLNASMILAGMGPVGELHSAAAKIFAAIYALFSGLVFIAVMAVVLGPWLHRLMHTFHLDRR